jgi:hypothetical protein
VLADLLGMIMDRDPGFPERFIASPRPKSKRTQIARSPIELFPGRPDLAARTHASREFRPGWWVDVNLSTDGKMEFVRRVCVVANLRFGIDVKVEFGKA